MSLYPTNFEQPASEVDARARLVDMVAANTFPQLTTEQVDRLLRQSRRTDKYGWRPSWDTEWEPNIDYAVNDVVVPTIRNGHTYIVTDPGTSGAVEPTWPKTAQSTVTLDGVTYQEITEFLAVWWGRWDLDRAASEGWRIKAGLVSNRHQFGSNQGNYNPEQIFEHCNQMAEMYAARTVGAIVSESGRWDGSGRIPGAHYDDAV